jgi:hypothetical protein
MKNITAANIPGRSKDLSGVSKAILAIVFFLFCGFIESTFAQDIIILKSGKELKVNIIEESTDIVKYREFNNPAGPLYSIGKDKVASLQYKKGTRDAQGNQPKAKENVVSPGIEPPVQSGALQQLTAKKRYVYLEQRKLSVRQVKDLMDDHPEALRLYVSGKALGNASNACAYGVMIVSFGASGIVNKQEETSDKMRIGYTALAIDGVLILSGIVLASVARHHIRNSVTIYNSEAGKPVTYKVDFGLQDHGIGVALKF